MEKNTSTWRKDFPTSSNPLAFFWYSTKPHWISALISVFGVVTGSILGVSISYVFRSIVNAAASAGATHDFTALYWAAGTYICVRLAGSLMFRLSGFSAALWSNGIRATARYTLLSYITLHSRSYFADHFAGSLSNKISHAANGTRELMSLFLYNFLDFTVSAVASIVLAFTVSPSLGTMFAVWTILSVALNIFFAKKRAPHSYATQELETKLNGRSVDLLSNISAMQDFARRSTEVETLREKIDERRVAGIRNWHGMEKTLVINISIQTVCTGLMIFMAVKLIGAGVLTVGDIVLIISLIFAIQGQMQFIGSRILDASEKWGEVKESLDEILDPHEIVDIPNAADLVVTDGVIDFDNMDFKYGEADVFKDFSLHIPKGQRVGLVGRSGAGKSTLVRLLMRHHNLNGGAIKIDGADIAKVTQDSLHRAIGIVPQESVLFHRTLTENIAYGKPDATQTEIERAATLAHAAEFIANLKEGYDSMVGERGIKLSGGERQRIAIARAILKNAPILLLDEATSALDSESEVAIQSALQELMKGKTVIAIAHRLSTLRQMDRIIVMEKGRIAEDGTHDELVAQGGIYAQLWGHQAGGFLTEDE